MYLHSSYGPVSYTHLDVYKRQVMQIYNTDYISVLSVVVVVL